MQPVRFVKQHPLATVTLFAGGMVLGPWLATFLASKTGVGISLPTVGGNGS